MNFLIQSSLLRRDEDPMRCSRCIPFMWPVILPSRKCIQPMASCARATAFIWDDMMIQAARGTIEASCSKEQRERARRYRGIQNASSGWVWLLCIHSSNSSTDSMNWRVRSGWGHRLRWEARSSGRRQLGHLSSSDAFIRETCKRVPQNLEACLESHKVNIASFFCWKRRRDVQSTLSNCSVDQPSSVT